MDKPLHFVRRNARYRYARSSENWNDSLDEIYYELSELLGAMDPDTEEWGTSGVLHLLQERFEGLATNQLDFEPLSGALDTASGSLGHAIMFNWLNCTRSYLDDYLEEA